MEFVCEEGKTALILILATKTPGIMLFEVGSIPCIEHSVIDSTSRSLDGVLVSVGVGVSAASSSNDVDTRLN